MTQVSVGQVENLEDLVRDLETMRDALESACREQVTEAESKFTEAHDEAQNSEGLLAAAQQAAAKAQQAVSQASEDLASAKQALDAAEADLSSCEAQPRDEDDNNPDCSGEAAAVSKEEAEVSDAQAALDSAQAALMTTTENRQQMEQRMEKARQALQMAKLLEEQTQQECAARLALVNQSVSTGHARLSAAQQALQAYLATNPPAAQFHSWLNWHPEVGRPITPDVLRDRMNLSTAQQHLLQEYLYDRNPAYHGLVDKYRADWIAAKGDAERNAVARHARTHLCGAFAEHLARHAIEPLGSKVETQGRTFVGDGGRYTKTDLLVTGLRVPVILGRGDNMGAPVGGSMAFEIKCGKADYLYAQKDHMLFQAEGHKHADAHCTLCSRDIHDLPCEKEKELRDALRNAESPLVGMLPSKSDIDRACLSFLQNPEEEAV